MFNHKIIRLNQIYRQLNQQEYPHWLIPQEHELFSPLKTIGIGTYQPTETQIRQYDLARQEFRLDFFDSTVSLRAIALPETNLLKESVTIYTDESVALGITLLRLKKILGLEPKETNFEIIHPKSQRSLIKSRFIHEKYLDLRFGSHLLKFRYGLNQSEEVILLYPTKYNNQTIKRFESANVWLKQLNAKYLNKCLVHSGVIAVKNNQQNTQIYGLNLTANQTRPQEKRQDFSSKEITATFKSDVAAPPLKQRVKQHLLQHCIAQMRNFFSAHDFRGHDLSHSNLEGWNFSGSDFSGADLSGANLYVAHLSDTNLSGADLSYADLSYADLREADLTQTNLTGANLTGANLTKTNLTGANLTGANLTKTNLTGANLIEADLTQTLDLNRAIFSEVQLTQTSTPNSPVTNFPRGIGDFVGSLCLAIFAPFSWFKRKNS